MEEHKPNLAQIANEGVKSTDTMKQALLDLEKRGLIGEMQRLQLEGALERATKEKFNLLREQKLFGIKNEIVNAYAFQLGKPVIGPIEEVRKNRPNITPTVYLKDVVSAGRDVMYDEFNVSEDDRR